MKDTQNLHLLYKKLGETPLECIERFKQEHTEYTDTPVTYAGRLDPMAEGLLLALSGEGVRHKNEYLKLPKTYYFDVLWGFGTDTLDVLGLVQETDSKVPEESEVVSYVEKNVGAFEQMYPAFSSRPVLGKPLFTWAREGKMDDIETPYHEVEVYSSAFISREAISKEDLEREIGEKIGSVRGDFRQRESLKSWIETIERSKEESFVVDTFSLSVSSGFYIRQFVSDMGKALGCAAVTFHIKRTKVGDFEL